MTRHLFRVSWGHERAVAYPGAAAGVARLPAGGAAAAGPARPGAAGSFHSRIRSAGPPERGTRRPPAPVPAGRGDPLGAEQALPPADPDAAARPDRPRGLRGGRP